MRFDILSVFPEFFQVLQLSLVGKAQKRGIMEVHVHDLRDWTEDSHRTVDDTPAGGGAGMVMRPDIWGKALDSLITHDADRTVIAIPTPAGIPLTQKICEKLAQANHIIVACGRYEGIDSRVADEYSARGSAARGSDHSTDRDKHSGPHIEVIEYSLGDYVLNGGEVAAVALVEAVGRLLPGMVGNPESLVEESHGNAGLLEYPVYTRPAVWKGHEIPAVLTSGDHGAIKRWRRERALERTVARRPDMIRKLDTSSLDKHDRDFLARLGYLALAGRPYLHRVSVREAVFSDIEPLVELAARTFPDACPPGTDKSDIEAFIAENLSREKIHEYVTSAQALMMVLDVEGEILGYCLAILPSDGGVAGEEKGAPKNYEVSGFPRQGPLVELSKFYLDQSVRGSGAREILWEETLARLANWADRWECAYVWLGTNIDNRRAQKAYTRLGFEYAGKRNFLVGDKNNVDRIYVRPINVP